MQAALNGKLKFMQVAARLTKKSYVVADERGASFLEFSYVGAIFLPLMMLVADIMTIGWNWAAITYAVNEAAIQAVRDGNDPNYYNARALVRTEAQNMGVPMDLVNVPRVEPLTLGTGTTLPGSWFRVRAEQGIALSPVGRWLFHVFGGNNTCNKATATTEAVRAWIDYNQELLGISNWSAQCYAAVFTTPTNPNYGYCTSTVAAYVDDFNTAETDRCREQVQADIRLQAAAIGRRPV